MKLSAALLTMAKAQFDPMQDRRARETSEMLDHYIGSVNGLQPGGVYKSLSGYACNCFSVNLNNELYSRVFNVLIGQNKNRRIKLIAFLEKELDFFFKG